jgi:parvulin-like peptidyl-prolyl isomerase
MSARPRDAGAARAVSPPGFRAVALILLVVAASLFGLGLLTAACADGEDEAADVAATVDGVTVLEADVRSAMAAAALAGTDLSYERARSQLIDEVLMLAEAERLGVTVDAADVDARVQEVADDSGGRKALEDLVEKAGLSLEEYAARVRSALLAEHLADAKFERVGASLDEARAYVERNPDEFTRPAEFDVGDIVVRTEAQGEAVRARIADGQSFASAARQFSSDPSGKADGGRMGWVLADSVPSGIRTALERARVGEVTAPQQAPGGWHVLKLYGRRDEKRFTFDEVRDDIVAELTRRRRVAALRRWLEGARERADIEIAR